MTQAEAYRQIARRWYDEVFAGGKLEAADEIFSSDFISHDPGPTGAGWPSGPEGPKAIVKLWRGAFPDASFTLEDQIVDGDVVVTRWTARGTHQGELLGMAPSGAQVQTTGIEIFRIQEDKVAEHWGVYDLLGILMQVGAIPTPDAATV
jgi:predicted ester cyclase